MDSEQQGPLLPTWLTAPYKVNSTPLAYNRGRQTLEHDTSNSKPNFQGTPHLEPKKRLRKQMLVLWMGHHSKDKTRDGAYFA